MAAAGQKKVSSTLDAANSAAVVTVAVRADTRRACSEEKVSFHERTAKTLTQESASMASVPSKDFFRSGGPGESHPRAPTEPCVTVSRYTALVILGHQNDWTQAQWLRRRGH